jgi:hypothetical protein
MIKFDMGFQFSPNEMKKIISDIRRGFLSDIRSNLLKAVPHLEQVLPGEIKKRIKSSDVIQELMNGTLRYDLGITKDEAVMISEKIPDVISKLLQVRVAIEGDTTVFLIVEMVKSGYEDLLDISEASFLQTYTQSTPKQIDWLKWLLTEGNNIIISDFRVKYTPDNVKSRSGGAIMIQKGSFRIPPQFSGTEDDNFITRSLEGIQEFIYSEIQKFINI